MMTLDARGLVGLCAIGVALLAACTAACIPGAEPKGQVGDADSFARGMRDRLSVLLAAKDNDVFLHQWFRFVSDTYGVELGLSHGGTYVVGQGNLVDEMDVGGGGKTYLIRTADKKMLKIEPGVASIVYCDDKGAAKLHSVAAGATGSLLVTTDKGFLIIDLGKLTMVRAMTKVKTSSDPE